MIAIDTNLLVYAHRSQTPEHHAARKAIERASGNPQGWGTTLTNLLEFWSIVTHATATGRPSTPREASSFFESLVRDGHARLWLPSRDFERRLTRLAVDLKVSGARIFDLAIALTAAEGGASELWTHDERFVTIPGLRVRHPLKELP
jgi:toxin-antitoxin system PIN domain toxin